MKKNPGDNIQQLGNLIERYKKILKPPQASVEKVAIDVIKERFGITLQPNQISYTVASKILAIKAPSLIRSELMRQSGEIKAELRNRLGEHNSPTTLI